MNVKLAKIFKWQSFLKNKLVVHIFIFKCNLYGKEKPPNWLVV